MAVILTAFARGDTITTALHGVGRVMLISVLVVAIEAALCLRFRDRLNAWDRRRALARQGNGRARPPAPDNEC